MLLMEKPSEWRVFRYFDEINEVIRLKKSKNHYYVYYYPKGNRRGICLGRLEFVMQAARVLSMLFELPVETSDKWERELFKLLQVVPSENLLTYLKEQKNKHVDYIGYYEALYYFLKMKLTELEKK